MSKKSSKKLYAEYSCTSISSEGLEHHKIETEDGFILSLFRVVKVGGGGREDCGENEKDPASAKPSPVLLITGLFNSGTEWLQLEGDKNLPNMLLKEGYDCWMGCVRGTPHSRGHTKLKPSSRKFWDFSLDEMSLIDLPSLIDYVLAVTGSKDLAYVGYSLGGAMIFATLNLKPEYAKKVRVIVGLAPAVYGQHFGTVWNKMFIPIAANARRLPFLCARSVGDKPLAHSLKYVVPSCMKVKRESLGGWLAKRGAKMMGTVVSGSCTEREMFNRIAQVMPASTSMKHVSHIAQCFSDGKFRAFNYGQEKNLKKYGKNSPPLYELKNITVPVANFTAAHDRLVSAKDVQRTSDELPNLISHVNITTPKFSHCDFLFGKDAEKLVYERVISIFNRFPGSAVITPGHGDTGSAVITPALELFSESNVNVKADGIV